MQPAEEISGWIAVLRPPILPKTPKIGRSKRKPRILKICANPYCGDLFATREYDTNRGGGIYCSGECIHACQEIVVPSKKKLKEDYQNGLSTNDIALKYKISKGTVYNLFKKYKIQGRSLSESLTTFLGTEKGFSAIQNRLKTVIEKYGTACVGGSYCNWGNPKSRLKSGFKDDIGVKVRSGWEGNVLRWLTSLGKKWQYEPRTFIFEGIKKGTMGYMPDIFLPDENMWIEVKGYLNKKDRTKLKRFRKYFPAEFAKFQMIVLKDGCAADKFAKVLGIPIYAYYRDLNRQYRGTMPNWE